MLTDDYDKGDALSSYGYYSWKVLVYFSNMKGAGSRIVLQ